MERILGCGDLAQVLSRMRKRPDGMPLLQRRHLVRSFLEALKHIHGCRGTPAFVEGVAHLDIKPNNIVFDELMDCYLVDFDTARAIGAPVGVPRAPGVTPLYTSPEMYAAYPWDRPDAPALPLVASEAHDVICMALVIWEVLDKRHRPAFATPEAARAAYTGTGEYVLDVTTLDFEGTTVQEVLRGMLARDPAKRPSAARVLRSPFFDEHGATTLLRGAAAAATDAAAKAREAREAAIEARDHVDAAAAAIIAGMDRGWGAVMAKLGDAAAELQLVVKIVSNSRLDTCPRLRTRARGGGHAANTGESSPPPRSARPWQGARLSEVAPVPALRGRRAGGAALR